MKKIESLYLAKGICIILVMIFHLADFIPLNERDVLTLFRLPTFVMISGCLFNVKSGMLEFVKRKVKTLLVPFAFFYTITCVIVPFILLSCFGVKLETYLGWRSLYAFIYPCVFPNIPLWFLWALFVLNVLFLCLYRLSVKMKGHGYVLMLLISFVALLAVEYLWCVQSVSLPAFLDRVLLYMPFFSTGIIISNWIKSIESRTLSYKALLFAVSCVLSVIFIHIKMLSQAWYIIAIASYVAGFSGAIVVLSLSSIFVHIPIISYMGRYSLIVLVTHSMYIRLFVIMFDRLHLVHTLLFDTASVFLIFASVYFTIPIMRRYIPMFVAQKK